MLYIGINEIQNNNKIKYLETNQFLDLFDRLDMMDIDNVKSGLETVFVNLNRNLLTYIEFIVDVFKSGGIIPSIKINTLPMNPYNIGFFSYLGEIIWLTIFINFIYIIFKMFSEIYN